MDPFTPLTSGEKHQRREKIKDCSRENKGGKQRKDCTVGEGIRYGSLNFNFYEICEN
jgi:hypothetical protein